MITKNGMPRAGLIKWGGMYNGSYCYDEFVKKYAPQYFEKWEEQRAPYKKLSFPDCFDTELKDGDFVYLLASGEGWNFANKGETIYFVKNQNEIFGILNEKWIDILN